MTEAATPGSGHVNDSAARRGYARLRERFARRAPLLATLPCAVVAFLLILAFGAPSRALGLDPSWTEVLAWGFLHHAQWGRDLIFTYGPLGFLQPYASYVQGIFPWYVAGEIAMPAAFVLSIVLLFRRGSLALFALFAFVYVCWCSRLSGDVSWALTLVFGAGYLIGGSERMPARVFYPAMLAIAIGAGMIALAKFSLFPLWVLSAAAVAGANLAQRELRRALACALAFPLALVAAWIACHQQLVNLPLFLARSLEVARGYPHAMGAPAPAVYEYAGLGLTGLFAAVCAVAAWRRRSDMAALIALALCTAAALLFWLAFFTRGDHWPWYFPAIALLAFVPLCNERLDLRRLRPILVAIVLAGTAVSAIVVTPRTIVVELSARVRNSVFNLTHLQWLQSRRDGEWNKLAHDAALPRIRARVRNARIDMLTWEQGIILINGLNYAPRPVFQSYSAYTPALARLNEAYFLGPQAPEYVALRLDAVDGRLPMSEDGLAMLALLRRYRPLFVEKRFLLLQRDVLADAAAFPAPAMPLDAHLGDTIPLDVAAPSVAALDVRLNAFGKLYTLLFREPALQIAVSGPDGKEQTYRLVRATAASGFLLQPVLSTIGDWTRLYLGKPLPKVTRVRVDTESPWERWLFEQGLRFGAQPVSILTANGQELAGELEAALMYPGFNEPPVAPETDLRVVTEGDEDVVFLHAPSTVTFRPAAGRYTISALYGVQNNAVNDGGCTQAGADGVGVSLVLRHAGADALLWHAEVDPFHDRKARGPQHLTVDGVDIAPGDEVDYRVDAGHGGKNIACDWSYVRDLVFKRRLESAASVAVAYPGFNLAPLETGLHVRVDDGKPSVFVHAPGSITFQPTPGRYAFTATYGVQNVAVSNEDCVRAGANGVGVSLVLQHAGSDTVLAHQEIDPFASPRDRGPHTLRVAPFDVGPADKVQYRVDAGRGGTNVSCDWSYVRDAVFQNAAAPAPSATKH